MVRREAALAEADEVAARADLADLPLAGVPVAVKDNVAVSGEPMRDGSAGLRPDPAERPTTRWCGGCARPARSWSG